MTEIKVMGTTWFRTSEDYIEVCATSPGGWKDLGGDEWIEVSRDLVGPRKNVCRIRLVRSPTLRAVKNLLEDDN